MSYIARIIQGIGAAREAGCEARCLELCPEDCGALSSELKHLLNSSEGGAGRNRLHGYLAIRIPGERSYVTGNRPGCDPLSTRRRFPI